MIVGPDVTLHWFARELRALMAIDHPAVLRLMDFGETPEGDRFVVTELLQGVDLNTAVRANGPLPEDAVVALAMQACAGLKASHDIGIVHRDLKPANLFLTTTGRVVVLDFGLARATSDSAGHTLAKGMGTKLIGTPHFMAPEQVDGVTLSFHSDLFSLGATLYFLLTGAAPFQGKTALDVVTSIVMNKRIALKDAAPQVSEPLRAIVEQMLEPRPEQRPRSIDEVLAALSRFSIKEDALRRYAEGSSAQPEQDSRTAIMLSTTPRITSPNEVVAPRKRWLWLIVALGAAVFLATLLATVFGTHDDPAVTEAPALRPSETPLHGLPPPAVVERVEPLPPQSDVEAVPAAEQARGTLLCILKQWAEVWVDGKSIGRKQNAVQLDLPVGKHKLELRHPKYPPRELVVSIRKRQETQIEVDLAIP